MELRKRTLGERAEGFPDNTRVPSPAVDFLSKKVIYVASDEREYSLVKSNLAGREGIDLFMNPSEAYRAALSHRGELTFIASASNLNRSTLTYAAQLAEQRKDAKVLVMLEQGMDFSAPGVEVTSRFNPGAVLRRAGIDFPDITILSQYSLLSFAKENSAGVYLLSSRPAEEVENIPRNELVKSISLFKGKDLLVFADLDQESMFQLRRVARCVKVCITNSEVIESLKKDDSWTVLLGEEKVRY
ncbi:MAG: hypothetical protein QW035_03280 [Candidatus Anstonellales archaeon]